jgi:hypothetical protein
MSDEPYILIGQPVSMHEVATAPEDMKLAYSASHKFDLPPHLADKLLGLTLMLHTREVALRCPEGPHADPGLESRVMSACRKNRKKGSGVLIECSQGHWGRYPCGSV